MNDRVSQLAHCLQIIEETDDVERCAQLYPDLLADLRENKGTIARLAGSRPAARAFGQARSRQAVLTALSHDQPSQAPVRGFLPRLAGGIAVLMLLLAGAAGAAASTSGGMREMGPVSEVLAAVGLIEMESTDFGEDSQKATEPTEQEEPAPPPAQNVTPQDEPDLKRPIEPGAGVAPDVHEAIESTEPGPERGVAVSEAACESAHDPARLPEAAAEAHENQDKEPKDCSHPNADGTPGNGNGAKPAKEKEPGKPETTPGGPPAEKPSGGGPPGGGPPGQNKKP